MKIRVFASDTLGGLEKALKEFQESTEIKVKEIIVSRLEEYYFEMMVIYS